MEITQTIELPLRNQEYDITQEFIDEIFKKLEIYKLPYIAILSANGNTENAVEKLMLTINDFLDFVSSNENNLKEFKDINLINKYIDNYLITDGVLYIHLYLDIYSEHYNVDSYFFLVTLVQFIKNDVLIYFFYYYFVITNYIEKVYTKSNNKEEYVKNIQDIVLDLNKMIKDKKSISEIDNTVEVYFVEKR